MVHESQIIAVVHEHEAGAKAGDLARKHGVSAATLHSWKAKHGGLDVSDAKRLKAPEDENAKLEKLLADQMVETSARRELLSKKGGAAATREASHICRPSWACLGVGPAPSSVPIAR